MNPGIFREYDIRGIAGKDLKENDALLIGKGVGTFLQQRGRSRLTVGRDCRLTSDLYTKNVIEGLLSTGCDVTDIGVCPTPVLYFSITHFDQQGGVMVTASHNPPEYNGFKLCIGTDSIFGEDIQKIFKIISNASFSQSNGSLFTADASAPYKAFVEKNISIPRTLKVGLDAGNGTAGVVAVPVIKNLNCQVHDLYCDMDGTFPNHEADPTVASNLNDLIKLIREKSLDVGIAYDGDGDRIGVVDEKGNIVYGDKLIIIFAREILSRKPGVTFISDVKCSKTLFDDIEKHGGRAIMWKTGHSLIKQKMRLEKAELAGELSGHMFFSDRFLGFDDAIYASCRLIEILSKTGKRISDLLSDVPQTYSTPEIRVSCPDEKKFVVVAKVTDFFRQCHDVIDIDGVRVLFEDGWGLIRASNTQPALVLRFEAMSEKRLAEIRELIESALEKIKKDMSV
ncbi:MAG: phosphomannomutase/phosphoglucomutase [Desulfobacterales bacterium]|jgi:phosphomannomutase/phosphoglucomutase|nr:phosphomannomutase [Desulfobacter sp.]MDP6394689.1 phosphomannomutase/phosphoglucomutase [Desulfobacterales bacterium]MDP6681613.1 phosphomannomutase/phosphoglucomutase [Desulfobacterales bacterium]MDP6806763.1 phosphomannomutase/phosphoglucomutase [Desulfobacterales bacterium]|tara:strand:- start:39143 stop:40501 length:1359 start_codon:yes stop_codon:yes gene_type:complete